MQRVVHELNPLENVPCTCRDRVRFPDILYIPAFRMFQISLPTNLAQLGPLRHQCKVSDALPEGVDPTRNMSLWWCFAGES